ncbi:MAG: hypothetical protein GWM98_07815 [Nitrospinaceae bacterium]|nr:hypothetical protein [Nitrospinaceae bacterium]NIR54424.1 hypothetical protein [Nitrospinaceae bacterium]NIS84838.1 hypothetical protein [Nitrospinaceae bacterium]NIT81643.1 hypothetical protein [Nitrospinaceae bacterium]NIU43926.1 hypothetical protein [Nitrospinaceae bacterium]
MSNILQSVQVSILALGIIFLVLGILIWVIRVMVHFLPYEEAAPAPSKTSPAPAGGASSDQEEVVAAIQVALAHHLGKNPQEVHIVNISSI